MQILVNRNISRKMQISSRLRRIQHRCSESCIVTVIREHKYIRAYARAKDKKFNVNNAQSGENDSEGDARGKRDVSENSSLKSSYVTRAQLRGNSSEVKKEERHDG